MMDARMKLVPFSTTTIQHTVNRFKAFDEIVKRCYPDVVLTSMRILFELFRAEKMKSNNPQVLMDLKNKAQALLVFAGNIQNFMPSNLYPQLLRMEINMR